MINAIYKQAGKYKLDENFIDLTDSNFARPEFFKSAYSIISNSFNSTLISRIYNPDPRGIHSARKSISKYYINRKLNISEDQILITASTSEAYNIIFQTFSNDRDEGLIPSPGYPLFEYLFKLNKIKSIFYFLNDKNKWQPDLACIENNTNENTRFLVLISPNNPTGSVISKTNLYRIINLCQKQNIILLIDEVFIPFTNNKYTLPSADKIKTPILILNGISKMFGLPDFKLGWVAVYCSNPELFIDQLETTNDVYLSANTFSQILLPDLFNNINKIQKPIISRTDNNRKLLNDFFTNNKKFFEFNHVEGGIHAFVKINNKFNRWRDEENFVIDLINNKKVFVHPGYFYDYKKGKDLYFSFSYILNEDKLLDGLERLKSFVSDFAH